MIILTRLFLLLVLLWPAAVAASEQIDGFDVVITVQKNGDIVVDETISVTSEGDRIRRGIFRDLPRYREKNGARLPYGYDVTRVERDGREEPYVIEHVENAFRIRIGDADVFLNNGPHVYRIEYAVKNEIRYFDDHDELYWNATGNYWAFPIERARAVVKLPGAAAAAQAAAYTGALGQTGRAYDYAVSGDDHVFTTTMPLGRGEGLTIVVGFEKGVVDPPSSADRFAEWWTRNVSLVILFGALGALSGFYAVAYNLVGRDPMKGPVFPRYEPPEGQSPAAVHHIYHRRFSGHQALIASLLNLAVSDCIKIDAKDKKKTALSYLGSSEKKIAPEEQALLSGVFNRRSSFTLGDGYDSAFSSAYEKFRGDVGKDFGKPFFKWNIGFLIGGVVLSVIVLVLAVNLSVGWTVWHIMGVAALVILSAAFSYFLPAPTDRGQAVRTEIEGFRLYLETAEKLQLNAVKPGSEAPPPMSVERYEKFLPYAIALGVERPWTKHFERLMPEEAANYQPRWAAMRSGSHHSLGGLNRALMTAIASGVVSAMPQSSSSSGFSGGGSSGGGGGGGGGGGW